MKKRFLCIVLILLLGAVSVRAQEAVSSDGLRYTTVDGLATVYGYEGTAADLVIPSRIGEEGAEVAAIEDMAFWGCTDLRTVFLSSGIRRIGEGAFCECTSLISFVLPLTVSEIEAGTFQACRSLTWIDIPRSIRQIGEYAFNLCTSLQQIQLPGTVRTLERYCFNRCSALASVVIGEGLERIEACAFANCPALRRVELPDSLVFLGEDVFRNAPDNFTVSFAGTRERWNQLISHTDGYDDLHVVCADDEITSFTVAADAPFYLQDDQLLGISIGTSQSYTSIGRAASGFLLAPGWRLRISVPLTVRPQEENPVTTGTVIQVIDPTDTAAAAWTVIIMGDVCETGLLNIAQVVKLARMLGSDASGPAALAGDWNGSGKLDIADLVAEASLLTARVSRDAYTLSYQCSKSSASPWDQCACDRVRKPASFVALRIAEQGESISANRRLIFI